MTFYFRDTFRFFMLCVRDGSLETGRHGGWGPVHIPPGVGLPRSARKFFLMLRCKAVATRETNESIRAKPEPIRESDEVVTWCPGAESRLSHNALKWLLFSSE